MAVAETTLALTTPLAPHEVRRAADFPYPWNPNGPCPACGESLRGETHAMEHWVSKHDDRKIETVDPLEDLKLLYGTRGAVPGTWAQVPQRVRDSLSPDTLRQCTEESRLGMEKSAVRLAYCRQLGRVYKCKICGGLAKSVLGCKSRMCLACAAKNFDAFFAKYKQVDNLISPAVRTLPGWRWHVLDFSFQHDGDAPNRSELAAMTGVMRRTVKRAVREACREWFDARKGCRLRLNSDGTPMLSPDGWPMGGRRDGEARELKGWTVIFIAEHEVFLKRWQGPRGAKKTVPARWGLRFSYEFIRVTEFGFDNENVHFHSAFFGPRLNYDFTMRCGRCGSGMNRKSVAVVGDDDGVGGGWSCPQCGEVKRKRLFCWGALVDIFKRESGLPLDKDHPSRGGLGRQSYTVFFEPGRCGFLSVLAHALKYTKKIPRSTPEGLARLEHTLRGSRRVALLGAHYGVPLKAKPRGFICPFPSCRGELEPVKGIGLVPVWEISDLPDAIEETGVSAFESLDLESGPGLDVAEVRGP